MAAVDLLELTGVRRTPYIQQSEASECGLACLAMVAGYHGLKTDMPTLRRRFSLSLKGATLKAIMGIAEQIGFNARPLRGEIENLDQLSLPAILHWNLNHFVVLTKVTRGIRGRRFHIHDPARGVRAIGEAELSRHFTGVVLELIKSETFKPASERSKLRIGQLWSKMSGLWPTLRNVLFLSIILQVVALALPFYLQLAVDTVFPSFDTDLLKMLALGFGGLMLIQMLTSWLRSLILVSLGSSLSYQVVTNLYRHLLRLPLPWFEKRHVGDIISRFGSTRPISDLLAQGLISSIIDGFMAFITLGLMFLYSPKLAGLALLAWGLFAALKIGFIQALRMRNIDAITTAAKEQSSFIESVRGIQAIKAFGQEGNRQRIWQQLKADSVNADIKLGRLTSGFDAAGQFILAIERVLFVYFAITMAMRGDFTVGMIFAFQAYKQQFLEAATRLVQQGISYKLLDVHLNRISDVALAKPEVAAEPRSDIAAPVRGLIELRNVGFRYGAGELEVLRGVNLRIEPGEMVALTGPSGGGKTTLLKIMCGLFEPSYGQVLVDGRPLASLGLEAWRRQIGTVMQEDVLYAGSLAENIAFFDPAIDMARVMEVAGLSAIHDEIAAMPMGYDTLVGDMGSALSGGQKQRVLLARALYVDPKVLFIDEGTSHLDAANEGAINEAVSALGITRLIVAHRSETVATAEKVFVVRNGSLMRGLDAPPPRLWLIRDAGPSRPRPRPRPRAMDAACQGCTVAQGKGEAIMLRTLRDLEIEQVSGGFEEPPPDPNDDIVITGRRLTEDDSAWLSFWTSNGDASDTPNWFRQFLDGISDSWAETDEEKKAREEEEQRLADEEATNQQFVRSTAEYFPAVDKNGNPINAWYSDGTLWVDRDSNGKADIQYLSSDGVTIVSSTDGGRTFDLADNPLNTPFPTW